MNLPEEDKVTKVCSVSEASLEAGFQPKGCVILECEAVKPDLVLKLWLTESQEPLEPCLVR